MSDPEGRLLPVAALRFGPRRALELLVHLVEHLAGLVEALLEVACMRHGLGDVAGKRVVGQLLVEDGVNHGELVGRRLHVFGDLLVLVEGFLDLARWRGLRGGTGV